MKIYYDVDDETKDGILKNIIKVDDDKNIYRYVIKRNKDEALIETKDNKYLEEVTVFYHKDNEDIYKYYNKDKTFLKIFNKPYIYKLPVNIIRPLKITLEKERVEAIDSYYDELNIVLPVIIIEDEYFLYDGHKRLLSHSLDHRMVDVYLKDIRITEEMESIAYLIRELNYKTIKDIEIISKEEMDKYS